MKKILIQSHDFYPKTSPAAKRIYSFVDFLTKEGWEVHLFSMVEKKYLPQLKRKFPNLTIFSLSEKFRTWNNKLQRLLRNWYFYKNTIKLFKENNIIDYDYALATSPEILPCLAMLKISKAFRIKLILDVRDIWPDVLNEMKIVKKWHFSFIFFNFIANKLYKKSYLVTTVSNGKQVKLKNKKQLLQKEVALIENGFDESMLDLPISEKTIYDFQLKKGKLITYIGNLGLAQGLKTFIDLAKKYDDNKSYRFLIIGKGTDKDFLLKYSRDKKVKNIEFYNPVSQDELATILKYSSASYVSLTSDLMLDSIPSKLYESLGLGCPTFLVAHGESRKLIDETQHGVYVDTNNFDEIVIEFSRFLSKLSEMEKRKKEVSKYIVENYSREKQAQKFVSILK